MSEIKVYKGLLKAVTNYEGHETVELNDDPIAEVLEDLTGKTVTVRYYISDKEADEYELQEDFLINTLYGETKSKYHARYSEITGYLWTDDELVIGGHDLKQELESYDGKYLYLIAEIHNKDKDNSSCPIFTKDVSEQIAYYRDKVQGVYDDELICASLSNALEKLQKAIVEIETYYDQCKLLELDFSIESINAQYKRLEQVKDIYFGLHGGNA